MAYCCALAEHHPCRNSSLDQISSWKIMVGRSVTGFRGEIDTCVAWEPCLASNVELAPEQRRKIRVESKITFRIGEQMEQRFRDGTVPRVCGGQQIHLTVVSWPRKCTPVSKSNFKVVKTLKCSRIFIKRDWKQTECLSVGDRVKELRSIYN